MRMSVPANRPFSSVSKLKVTIKYSAAINVVIGLSEKLGSVKMQSLLIIRSTSLTGITSGMAFNESVKIVFGMLLV